MMQDVLHMYLQRFPDDAANLELLANQLTDSETMNDRKNFRGHITGAAIILSADSQKVLLVHHRFLNKWLQPGGHWDPGETDPLHAARREAEEETAVLLDRYVPLDTANPMVPIHIATHAIPANPDKQEANHFHHDFRYVFLAKSQKLSRDEVETLGAAWFELDAPETVEIAEALHRVKDLISE